MILVISTFLLFILTIICAYISCLDKKFSDMGPLAVVFLVLGIVVGMFALISELHKENPKGFGLEKSQIIENPNPEKTEVEKGHLE